MTTDKLEKMYYASNLLPDPGGEVVRECIDEIIRLRQALNDICFPIQYLKRNAEAEGLELNNMSISISKDPLLLQEIAQTALNVSN